jgi:hypothetical protein
MVGRSTAMLESLSHPEGVPWNRLYSGHHGLYDLRSPPASYLIVAILPVGSMVVYVEDHRPSVTNITRGGDRGWVKRRMRRKLQAVTKL